MSENFFSRWSRRKQAVAEEAKAPPAATPTVTAVTASTAALPDAATQTPSGPLSTTAPTVPAQGASGRRASPEAQPLPTLEDVQSLTPQSDFQPFMQPGVGSAVRNAAMKKLFADPHFNVMDGLDIYIDDYSQPDPLPEGMLARMASAQFMKLVPEPQAPTHAGAAGDAGGHADGHAGGHAGGHTASPGESQPRHPQDPAAGGDPGACSEVVAQSPLSSPKAAVCAPSHDHPDLQLQPNLAPADPDPGSRPG